MSIQNAINSILSDAAKGVALYAYSPYAEEKKKAREDERELDLQADRAIQAGIIRDEARDELKNDPENEDWQAIGKAAQEEVYSADARSLQLMRNRYLRTGDPADLQTYLESLTEQEMYKKPESIETAVAEGRAAADARKIEEDTGFTPEEWEDLAMRDALEENYGNEQAKLADDRAAKQIIDTRSQKANFEAHKEQLRRKQYKHTRYQGRMGGDR